MKFGASFPTDHPLHAGAPGSTVSYRRAARRYSRAHVILQVSTGSISPLPSSSSAAMSPARSSQISVDHRLHNGWSIDYQGLPPVDVLIASEPDVAVPVLLERLAARPRAVSSVAGEFPRTDRGQAHVDHLADALATRSANGQSLTHVLVVMERRQLPAAPSARLSRSDGGGGVGGGPYFGRRCLGAQRQPGGSRSPSAVTAISSIGCTTIWTAAHYKIRTARRRRR